MLRFIGSLIFITICVYPSFRILLDFYILLEKN